MTIDGETELGRWRDAWLALGGEVDLANDLAARVQADGRRLRKKTLYEIAAGVYVAVFAGWLFVRTLGDLPTTFMFAATLVGQAFWLIRLWLLRRGTLRSSACGLDAFVELTRRRLSDDLKWNAFVTRSLQVGWPVIGAWCVWRFGFRLGLAEHRPLLGGLVLAGMIAMIVWHVVLQTRRRRSLEAERERFESLVVMRMVA